MSRSYLGRRFDQVLGAIVSGRGPRPRREKMGRSPHIESLESRSLLATIIPSGVISSTPVAGGYDYTIALANSSASNSGIGSFWYAWVPGQDYLATAPISVTPPAGWTDQISHSDGSADGYAIQFVADSPSDDVQPGNSLDFSFTSADTPASVEGNSVFYSDNAGGNIVRLSRGAFSDAGHQFVVTAAPTLASIAITPVDPNVPTRRDRSVHGGRDSFRQLDREPDGPGHLGLDCNVDGDDLQYFRIAGPGHECRTGPDHDQCHAQRDHRLDGAHRHPAGARIARRSRRTIGSM